jgi:hypothetical protein
MTKCPATYSKIGRPSQLCASYDHKYKSI